MDFSNFVVFITYVYAARRRKVGNFGVLVGSGWHEVRESRKVKRMFKVWQIYNL